MLLDSNIIIYAVKPDYTRVRGFIKQHNVIVASVSQIETLGYHELADEEESKLERLFDLLRVCPLTEHVIRRSINLRRRRQGMTTVDSVIAATAIEEGEPLATHDTSDFDWIEELKVVDPVSAQ